MAGETSPGKATLVLTVDLDKLAVGAGVAGLSSPLQKLLSQAPSGTQGALDWLPDLSLSDAETLLSLNTGNLGAYVAVSDADGNALASTWVFVTTTGGQEDAAIGLSLNSPVDLAGTPLFGTLLSGVRITDLAVSYASTPFNGGDITLPVDAPPVTDVPAGLGLTTTVDGNGSVQTFSLPSPGSTASAASAARALAAPAASPGTTPSITWFDVQKELGPLSIDRVGVVAGDGTLGLALDASLETDVVSIQLTGFTVAFAPASMATSPPSVSLDGLAVSVSADPVQIAGSLVRSQGTNGVEYDGSLLIRAGSFAIDAAGSYTVLAGAPSLFVFGVADGPFGGPPAFFVTGLAAGFGVNRALRLPSVDTLATYPLIVAAGSSVVAPGTQGTQDALTALNTGGWVPPTRGEYWVAAGVQFQSFELINGVLLATVEFGTELVIALLGLASLQFPTDADNGSSGGPVYAYVEIALEAVLRPSDGVLTIEALLTPNSFVIDKSCHLTGGLAFYSWFGSNPHAGDFAFTIGGYHPLFTVPAWYPVVPRLGFSWQVSDTLAISGEAYFAVTPTAIMGGGRLSAMFAAGGLRAWFIEQVDIIVSWRPFWYDFEASISIGVSYTGTIAFVSGTFTVELGVSVHLWGPPLRGLAHVDWWVISFDIPINIPSGESASPPAQPVVLADWTAFATTSLPAPGTLCRGRPAGGLQSIVTTVTPSGTAGETIWLFGGDTLGLATESAIPASGFVIGGQPPVSLDGLPVSVYPLASGTTVTATHEVCVAEWTAATAWQPGQTLPAGKDVSGWGWATVTVNLPAALWGVRGSQAQPPLDGSATVAGMTGLTGSGQAIPTGELTVQTASLLDDPLPARGLPLGAGPLGGPGPVPAGDTRSLVAATLNDPTVVALRAAVLGVASSSGLRAGLSPETLPLLAAETYAVLTSQPMLGPPGTTGPPATTGTATAGQQGTGTTAAQAAAPIAPGAAPTTGFTATGQPVLRAWFQRAEGAARSSVLVADRWATGAESRLLAAGDARTLLPGVTGVWDRPAQGAPAPRCGVAAALWVVALDAAQRPSQALIPPPHGQAPARTTLPVPTGATRVAVTALARGEPGTAADAGADGRTAGWRDGTELRQIASQVLLGAGAVIRPQSPTGLPRRRSRRSPRIYRELGVTTGSEMVERNWTKDAAGRVRRGWIETWLPSWSAIVAVSLTPDDGHDGTAAAPAPLVLVRRGTATVFRPLAGEPAAAGSGGAAGPSWLFTVADAPADGDDIIVRATAPDGWRLAGVAASETRDAQAGMWPR